MTVAFSYPLMLLVLLCGTLLGRADSTSYVAYETHNLATGVPGSGVSNTGVDIALLGLHLPGLDKADSQYTGDLSMMMTLQCGRNIIEVLPKKSRAPNSAPFLLPLSAATIATQHTHYNTWLVLTSLDGRLPRISSCKLLIDPSDTLELSPSQLITDSMLTIITQAMADVFLNTLNPSASQTVASLLTPPPTSFLEVGSELDMDAEAAAAAAASARLDQLLQTMQTLQSTHGTRAGHRIVWQLTLRGLALSVREYVLMHLQEAYYLNIKAKALPFLTELICTGKVDPIAMPAPHVDAPEPLTESRVDAEPVPAEGIYPAPTQEAAFVEVAARATASEPGAEGGEGGGEEGDDSNILKKKPSILFDLVSWIAAPVTSAVEPAIGLAVTDVLQQAVAMNVDDKLKRVVNATVAKRVGMATVTLLSERLTHGLARAITHGVVRKSIPGIVQELGSATLASLSHSLSMTLTRSLSRDPKLDAACKECGENMQEYKLQPAGTRKACNECKVSTWNDYYLDYYTSYYTQYYYGYYGFYYNSYFSRVFAEEQLARLEMDVAAASQAMEAEQAGAAEAQGGG